MFTGSAVSQATTRVRMEMRPGRCFVIMPFSETKGHHTEEYWTRHFDSYLKPLIEEVDGLEAFRSEPLRDNIAQIITYLTHSDVVLADLTDHNPSVLWELGVRQSFKHSTITIAEVGTVIPLHFSHKGILFYNGDHLNNKDFEERLRSSLRDCIEHPNEPDSPVLEMLGGRGSLYGIVHSDENQRRMNALIMEMGWNEEAIHEIFAKCSQNAALRSEKKKDQCRMIGMLLKSSALEFLYINRYLDADEEFYSDLLNYFNHITAVNKHLADWAMHSEFVEQWLLKDRGDIILSVEAMKKNMQKIKASPS
jgi:hypothetical protein